MGQVSNKLALGLNFDDYWYEARHCVSCGQCKWIELNYVNGPDFSYRCPSWHYGKWDSFGAAGKVKIVWDLLMGTLDYSSPRLLDVAYMCNLCGGCDVGCKRNLELEIQMMLETFRARLVEKGVGPMPQHKALTTTIEKSHFYGHRRCYAGSINLLGYVYQPVSHNNAHHPAICAAGHGAGI